MKNIDFLPPELLQKEEARLQRWWWLIVCCLFGTFIVTAATVQTLHRWKIQREMAAVEPAVQAAQQLELQLAKLRTESSQERLRANVLAMVACDWSRTALLREVTAHFPKESRLVELHIRLYTDHTASSPASAGAVAVLPSESGKQTPAEDPYQEDLRTLQQQMTSRHVRIELSGITRNPIELHHFVSELNASPLVRAAKLESLEATAPNGAASASPVELKFHVRIDVRPTRAGPDPNEKARNGAHDQIAQNRLDGEGGTR